MNDGAPSESAQNPPERGVVIGARIIVDILRDFAGQPPEQIQLTPMRNKAAQFVLEKSLQKIEVTRSNLQYPAPQAGVCTLLLNFACHEKKIIYMAQPDWGVARLLDSIFDAAIDQGRLDAESVWLFNRFRLPFFHATLSDYSFFFSRQNLARRFINAVTLHLLSTREPFARDMKFVLAGIASRMHEAFESEAAPFNNLCLEGLNWFAMHQQRVQKAETRVREIAQTRSRRQQADERVTALINRVIAGRTLPLMLVEFVMDEWRHALLGISMREGEQGTQWKRAARLTESLVEFVDACSSDAGRREYEKFLPSLIRGLQTSLAVMKPDDSGLHALVEPVELVLQALLAGVVPEMSSVDALPEVTRVEYQLPVSSSPESLRIEALEPGQWVRFRTANGQYEACSLALKAPPGEPWSFVSQSGQSVVSKTVAQLAALLAGGVLEIVGQGQLVDELLETLLTDAVERINTARAEAQERQRALHASRVLTVTDDGGSSILQSGDANHEDVHGIPPPDNAESLIAESALSNETPEALPDAAHCAEDWMQPAPDIPEALLQESRATVDALQIGARLVWYRQDGQDLTLKLAVRLRGSEKLVFVNHIGIKALEIHPLELARQVARGQVVIIDVGKRFDSALERIVKQIQQDKK